MVSFEVTNAANKVMLSWTAVNDQDETTLFTIEQSTDGKNWEPVATEASRGAAHQTISYSRQLAMPKSTKTAIYRIAFEGTNGEKSYSAAQSVSVANAEVTATVSNVGSEIRVKVSMAANEAVSVYVSTMDGKLIYNQAFSTTDAQNIAIPTSTPGMYIVTVTDNKSFKIANRIAL
jgi:hypothetical protein